MATLMEKLEEFDIIRINLEREALDEAINEFLQYARKDYMTLFDIEKEWMEVIERAKLFYNSKVLEMVKAKSLLQGVDPQHIKMIKFDKSA